MSLPTSVSDEFDKLRSILDSMKSAVNLCSPSMVFYVSRFERNYNRVSKFIDSLRDKGAIDERSYDSAKRKLSWMYDEFFAMIQKFADKCACERK